MKREVKIYNEPIITDVLSEFTRSNGGGAEVLFVGTTRNKTQGKEVIQLDFESYIPMAVKELNLILDRAESTYDSLAISVHHRIGTVKVGEIAVAISVCNAHRKEAFEACSYIMDELKKTVPIWKKEIFADGEVWVSAHP